LAGTVFTANLQYLVGDLINPIIGSLTIREEGDFTTLDAARDADAAAFEYGELIMALINLLNIALIFFILVRYDNRVKDASEKEAGAVEQAVPGDPNKVDLLAEIHDALE